MSRPKFTTKWSDVKPSGFYVYFHRRVSDGVVFYVGKGCDQRAWTSERSYNKYWGYVAAKHGVDVEITQDGMSEHDALLLEMWMIAKFRHEGVKLVNVCDGGLGGPRVGKTVHCSNGMIFDSVGLAVSWLNEIGFISAYVGNITSCCDGTLKSAYGFVWSYESEFTHSFVSRFDRLSEAKMIPVRCSNGMTFDSVNGAVDWLKSIGFNRAHSGAISACRIGKRNSAYGFTWSDLGEEPNPFRAPRNKARPIVCSNGMIFDKALDAADWLKSEGFSGASAGNISMCCNGKKKTYLGLTWKFTVDAPTDTA